MKERLMKGLNVKEGEMGLVFTLGAILFINFAAMGIVKVVSVSGFLSEVSGHFILLVWAVDMALLVLATALQSLIIDRFKRVSLLGGLIIVIGLLYALLSLTFKIEGFPLEISYTLLYLVTDQQWLIFPLIFWALVNDIYSPAQGRRLLPVIGSFAFLGTIVGLGVVRMDASFNFGPFALLLFNAAIFFVAWLLVRFYISKQDMRQKTQPKITFGDAISGGWEYIRSVKTFRALSVAMLATGITVTILLYDMLADAVAQFGTNFQGFYALYSLVIAVASFVVQFVSGKIIEKLGIRDTFAILPGMMLFGSVLSFFAPGIWGSAPAQGVVRVALETVDQSNRKAYQALVPDEKRGRVSIFIDSYLPSFGTILGSLIAFGVISWGIASETNPAIYSSINMGIAVLAAAVAVAAFFFMRAAYEKSLLSWQMKRRSRGSSVFDKLDF
jgi:AAA family ATP:ADP antiporter